MSGVSGTGEEIRFPAASDGGKRLHDWSRRQELIHGPAKELGQQLPGLLPVSLEGEVLAAGLGDVGGGTGFLLVNALAGQGFDRSHETLVQALCRPWQVILDNYHQLRKLHIVCEAAEAKNRSLLERLNRHDVSPSIIGAEAGLREVMEQVERVALSNVPVLLLGETGSGKEVIAPLCTPVRAVPGGPSCASIAGPSHRS